MIRIALSMLIGDKAKYIALVAGIAFASLLITQQASIFTGFAVRTGAWIRDTGGADLWVMDREVEFSEDIKPMLDTALTRVRGVSGVEWAVPMYKGYVDAILPDGSRRTIRLIGLDDATLIGGPPEMLQGSLGDLRQDRALLMNAAAQVLLKRDESQRNLRVGDTLSLNDWEGRIVGSYSASPEFFWEPVFYTTYSRARAIRSDERKTLMYILVKTRPDAVPTEVAQRINAISGLQALTAKQFETQTMWWILEKTGILVNFGITIVLGVMIGVLAAGQTLYTFILDNLKNFGALKAMGVSNFQIVQMMAMQVLVATVVGFGIGVGIAAMSGKALAATGLAFEMPWPVPVLGFFGVLCCCLLAGLFSVIRVLRLEPAVVFK